MGGVVDLRLARLHSPVTVLGPGRRLGLWLQGCSLACPGCMSRDTWAADGGWSASVTDLETTMSDLIVTQSLDGVTISGGEPFQQAPALEALLDALRARWPELDVLVYSGYRLDHLERHHGAVLDLVDAVISEPFVAARPTDEPWRGSHNQRLSMRRDRWRDRYALPPTGPRLQVGVDDHGLFVTGIPRRGDLARLVDTLAERGVVLEEVSWTS